MVSGRQPGIIRGQCGDAHLLPFLSGKIIGGMCCLLQTALSWLLTQGQSSLWTSFRQKKGTKEGEGYLGALGQRLGFHSSLCYIKDTGHLYSGTRTFKADKSFGSHPGRAEAFYQGDLVFATWMISGKAPDPSGLQLSSFNP